MGVGQFCTNPGLVIALNSTDLDDFIKKAVSEFGDSEAATMLNPSIKRHLIQAFQNLFPQRKRKFLRMAKREVHVQDKHIC